VDAKAANQPQGRLDPADVEAVAQRVAALLEPPRVGLVGVERLARELDVHPDWVYRHARALGGAKLGRSANSPWRFDIERAIEAAVAMGQPPPSSIDRPRRGRPRASEAPLPEEAELLRGRTAR
jgi:hypothetical protein